MPLPPFLLTNHQRIIDAPDQQIALWTSSYDPYRDEFEIVDKIYSLFPHRNIQRQGVINTFREDHYAGFIASMMWGGISATRPKTRGGNDTPFRRLLTHDPGKVRASISEADAMIAKRNLQKLFLSFGRGERNSISGIDSSYYTKLFFFLGQIQDSTPLKPLIFDKWTSFAHCALRLEVLRPGQNPGYSGIGLEGKNPGRPFVKLPTGKRKAELYELFVADFADWTRELNDLRPDSPVSVAKVEEFVFGKSLKIDKGASNPRVVLRDKVLRHFDIAG